MSGGVGPAVVPRFVGEEVLLVAPVEVTAVVGGGLGHSGCGRPSAGL